MLWVIIAVLGAIIVIVAVVALVVSKKDEVNEYYKAAKSILKEERLNEAIKNPCVDGCSHMDSNVNKPMIYIKSKTDKNFKFVFNPEKGINIGRGSSENQICINEATVSHRQCVIFEKNMRIFIKDFNSANGVEILRRSKKYKLSDGNTAELLDGDVLVIGSTSLKLVIFYYDMMYM